MTATYPNRFDASETLSRAQERSLLTALGLGLLVTVLALAWASVASRVEPHESATITPAGDTGVDLRVETRSAQWVPEDASF